MPRNDFSGDGRSDILWIWHENAGVSNWLATAGGDFTVNDANAYVDLAAWHVFDLKAAGDFNGDGRTDVLWQVDDSEFHEVWFASPDGGLDLAGVPSAGFAMGDSNWAIAGTGDFNGDGVDDLLWRNADGTLSNWLGSETGGFTVNDSNALIHVPNDWQIVTTADFNGDGRSDILWRNDNGMISNWLGTEDGGFLINDANALSESFGEIAGVGDFNGDGYDDLLWRAGDQIYASQTYGDGWMYARDWNTGFVANLPLGSVVAATGDFDGDGDDDIMWRHSSGALTRWLSEGDGYNYERTAIANVSNDWQIGDYLLA